MKDFISAEGISFGYEADDGRMIPVLEDLSISIREGEFVAVLGHNGSGKSTLAKHFNAVLLPSASFVTGIMFSNENVTNGFLYKYGAVICVVCGVFAATVGYLWCNLIF